jgi:hypothetical protein
MMARSDVTVKHEPTGVDITIAPSSQVAASTQTHQSAVRRKKGIMWLGQRQLLLTQCWSRQEMPKFPVTCSDMH